MRLSTSEKGFTLYVKGMRRGRRSVRSQAWQPGSSYKINTYGRAKELRKNRGPVSCRMLQVCKSVMCVCLSVNRSVYVSKSVHM